MPSPDVGRSEDVFCGVLHVHVQLVQGLVGLPHVLVVVVLQGVLRTISVERLTSVKGPFDEEASYGIFGEMFIPYYFFCHGVLTNPLVVLYKYFLYYYCNVTVAITG